MKELSRKEFMKGIASTTAFAVLSHAGIPALAADKTAEDIPLTCPRLDVLPCEADAAKYAKANSELVRYGEQLLSTRTTELILPCRVHYYQNNGDRWCSDIMQTEGLSISRAGCAVVSFAMIQRYMGGTADPGEVNSILGNHACLFNYEGAARDFGYTLVNKITESVTQSYVQSFAVGAIGRNMPILLGMKYGVDGTHFVMAYGYRNLGTPTIYILDPDHGKNYTQLQQYYDAGYSVHRLITYTK